MTFPRALCERSALRFLVSVLLTGVALAQTPDRFTNLQVLPKDISKQDLISMMRGFSFSLGVRCDHCHAEADNPTLSKMNFPSDEKETKRTARMMIRMVQAINRDYIVNAGNKSAFSVECFTCHRGAALPRTLQAVLMEALDKGGIDAAVSRYTQLRKETYGSSQYDFSETSLNLLAESLTNGAKPKEAAAMMELNAKVNNPLSTWGYSVLAMAHERNGELQKAEADFEKLVEINSKDSWAAERLKAIRAAMGAH
jgi:hypothetical protein